MKVGDFVRDKEEYRAPFTGGSAYGIIIEVDEPEGMYKVKFPNGTEWLIEMYLEVVSESR